MRIPVAAQEYHVAHFDHTTDAAAFVAALERFLESPRGSSFTRDSDSLEVWIDSASTRAGVEVYLSDDALTATTAGVAAPKLAGTRRGDALAPDCALVLGDALSLAAMTDANEHIRRRSEPKSKKPKLDGVSALELIRTMWLHSEWADAEIARALGASHHADDEAWREYLHILGAEEVWLSRIESRTPRAPVWPDMTPAETSAFRALLSREYATLLERIGDDALMQRVTYTTSDGRAFANVLGDILTHVALHGQYHRGKVNLLLRQRESAPAPVDFIGYIRGASAATQRSASSERVSGA